MDEDIATSTMVGTLVSNTIQPFMGTFDGQGAFSGCSSLASIEIPSSVTTISNRAFNNCTGLESIAVLATTPPTLGTDVFANAIIRFDGGQKLGKFSLHKDDSRLYIPQDGKDYAIVSAEAQGELPLNFEPATNGTYTLTVDTQGLELDYLHLIDNKTGADIDLLTSNPETVIAGEDPQSLTPAYTFTSQITDYPSRFKLVFVCGDANDDNDDNETFAFYDGSAWVVSNTGEATLQVIDVLGRIVSSQTINGNAAIHTNGLGAAYLVGKKRTQKLSR